MAYRRNLQNSAMADAFLKTSEGTALIVEAKSQKNEIGLRVRQLKTLIHSTFVSNVPRGHGKRFDVYQASKSRVGSLVADEAVYNSTVHKLKYAWTSREAYEAAVQSIA